MQEIRNFQIKQIGTLYLAHYNVVTVKLYADDFGFSIPFDRIPEFCALFPEINFEDGEFLEILKGKYMRYIAENGKVIGLKHIIKDLTYYSEKR